MKGNQGFQKGHGLLGGGFKGHKHSEDSLALMRAKLKGRKVWNKNKKGVMPTGSAHHSWRGGLPKCLDCDKKVSVKTYKRCHACNSKFLIGNKVYNFKGGYENKLILNKKRRALKLGAKGSHSLKEWQALKLKYNHMCLCCKQQEPFIKLTEDHIVPLTCGGSDDISNIQPLCFSCNARKSVKDTDFRSYYQAQDIYA